MNAVEESKSGSVKAAWIEHDERGVAHHRVEAVEQTVGAEHGPHAADARHEHEVVLLEVVLGGDEVANLFGRERAFEGAEKVFVALFSLHLEGLVEKAAMLEVVENDVEQVRGGGLAGSCDGSRSDPSSTRCGRGLRAHRWRIVEEVASDFVADALAREELLARDLGSISLRRPVRDEVIGLPPCSGARRSRRGRAGRLRAGHRRRRFGGGASGCP